VVEVVPVGAGTDPVVVRGSVVGLVVGVGRLEVEGTGLGVKLGGLVVETSSGGAVKNLLKLSGPGLSRTGVGRCLLGQQ